VHSSLGPGFAAYLEHDRVDRERYVTLLRTLSELRGFIAGRYVLDFGASYGLSICALLEVGASKVVGVEPDAERVERGAKILRELEIEGRSSLLHAPKTSSLAFGDEEFDVVIANAVLEHIPQPRREHIKEMWRLVRRGGHLIVNETPNKYLPLDFHTTHLWLIPWMPKEMARRYSTWRRRWQLGRDWESSGWRGIGYFELAGPLSRFADESPRTRWRHRALGRFGLPPQILDPYPTVVLRKL
jgi:ubiquinone/menaquinone biosynthesis C-methylase UbiE